MSKGRERTAGPLTISLFVISAAAPMTTVFGAIPAALAAGETSAVPTMFLLAGVLYLAFYIVLLSAAAKSGDTGAYHSHIAGGLGERMARGIGVVSLLAYLSIQIGVAALFGVFLNDALWPHGAPVSPWVWSLLAIAVSMILSGRPLQVSATLLGCVMVAEVVLLMLIDHKLFHHAALPASLGPAFSLQELLHHRSGATIAFIAGSFVGLEAVSMFKDDTPEAARAERQATYLSVLAITLIYVASATAIVAFHGHGDIGRIAREKAERLYLDPVTALLGPGASLVVQIMLIVSLFACVLSLARNILDYARFLMKGAHVSGAGQAGKSAVTGWIALPMLAAPVLFMVCHADPYRSVFPIASDIAVIGLLIAQIGVCLALLINRGRADGHLLSPGMRLLSLFVLAGLGAALGFAVIETPDPSASSVFSRAGPVGAVILAGLLGFFPKSATSIRIAS